MAEAHMPDLYKRRVEQTNLMEIDPAKLTPEQLDKFVEHLIQKAFWGTVLRLWHKRGADWRLASA